MGINAIDLALTRIRKEIPNDLLNIFFGTSVLNPFAKISIEENIIDSVIRSHVIKECNVQGGRTVSITLVQEYHEKTIQDFRNVNSGYGQYSLYRIPPEARDGCDIIEVHHVQAPSPHNQGGSLGGGGGECPPCLIKPLQNNLLDSITGRDSPRMPVPQLLHGNLIQLNPGYGAHIDWVVVCRVGYDENMTNLNGAALDSFAKLCVLATKLSINREGSVKVDTAFIQGGAEFESIKAFIDKYGDLQQEFDDLIKKFNGAARLDFKRVAPLLRMML